MADYARDIVMGNHEALARRYDPTGAFLLVGGHLEFAPYDRIEEDYAKRWTPPAGFEWRDLHFAAARREIVVNGRFLWIAENKSLLFSYTALLRLRHNKLFIWFEEETRLSD